MLIAALLAVAVAAEPPPYRGVPTFSIGMAGTRLSLVQHADNSLVLRASDAYGSVACAPYDAQVWPKYRAFFAQIAETWYTAPNLRFPSADPTFVAHKGTPGVCDLSAYTSAHHVFVEVAQVEAGVRTGFVRVELSPIETSHTIVETSDVQRAEDNTFGVRLLQVAAAMGGATAGQLHDMDRAVEDTSTYSKKVITAHTDLSLFVLVLDAWKETGALATNTVVESAYRVRDIIKDESSEFFFRVLGRFGRGDTAASIVVKLQACGEATPPAQCLDEHAEGK